MKQNSVLIKEIIIRLDYVKIYNFLCNENTKNKGKREMTKLGKYL